MARAETAELFTDRGSQAVRLPDDPFAGRDGARAFFWTRRAPRIDPKTADVGVVFAEIDRLGGSEFRPEGRPAQPPISTSDDFSLA